MTNRRGFLGKLFGILGMTTVGQKMLVSLDGESTGGIASIAGDPNAWTAEVPPKVEQDQYGKYWYIHSDGTVHDVTGASFGHLTGLMSTNGTASTSPTVTMPSPRVDFLPPEMRWSVGATPTSGFSLKVNK